jgi:Tol biopolymer transport system component
MHSTSPATLPILVLAFLLLDPTTASQPQPSGEARFLTNTRQLTFEGRRSGEGYFAADGKALVFQSEREPGNPFFQIYLLDLDAGDTRRISPGSGKTTCAFLRPGSDDVLFASTHLDPDAASKQKAEYDLRAAGKEKRYGWDYDEFMDVFVARRDGSNLRRLTDNPGYDAEGAYSPDGTRIVFCSLRAAFPLDGLSPQDRKRYDADPAYFGEIYLMNADGSGQKRLTTWPGYDGGPFFAPDGQRILWRHFAEDGTQADVYTMNLDGSDIRRLTDFQAMSWAPFFHPSSRYVIFASNKLGFANFELYLTDTAGSREPVRVTFQDGFDGLPAFSPDGTRLAWTSNRTPQNNSQILLANWNHAAALAALDAAPPRGTAPQPAATNTPPAQSSVASPAPTGALTPDITEADLRAHVAQLTSPEFDGRLTGTPGAQKAADYLAHHLRQAGLQPLQGSNAFFQPFDFNAGAVLITNQNQFSLTGSNGVATPLELGRDYRPLALTANGTVEGPVVFAGYGLTVPAGTGPAYDSYAGLDVSNKIVLVLRYVPEAVDAKRRQELNHHAGLRYKALIARNHGASALLVVTGPNSPNAGELVGFSYDGSQAGSAIVAASIAGTTANALFAGSGLALRDLQTALDAENTNAQSGIVLTNTRVRLTTAVQPVQRNDRNVLAWLPPADGSTNTETVLLGAHFDHLGHGDTSSMARKDEEGQIHAGADDNASGTAAVLEIAAAFAQQHRTRPESFRRGLLVAFWSGEELGTVGSAYYAGHPLLPLSNTVAYLNFDMVGRLRDNKLTLNGVGSSSAWRKLLEKRNVAAGFNLQLLDDPFAPTDVTSFYPKGLPVLAFFTGVHEEYHRPADRADTLDYPGIERIARFAQTLTTDLLTIPDRPDYLKVASPASQGTASRENLRAYLGTIPDFAAEAAGLKLSGTRPGSPAERAGLKPGDIVVEFAGQKVANIYDYTFALDAAKIGQPTTIIVLREGQRLELTITPEARK